MTQAISMPITYAFSEARLKIIFKWVDCLFEGIKKWAIIVSAALMLYKLKSNEGVMIYIYIKHLLVDAFEIAKFHFIVLCFDNHRKKYRIAFRSVRNSARTPSTTKLRFKIMNVLSVKL